MQQESSEFFDTLKDERREINSSWKLFLLYLKILPTTEFIGTLLLTTHYYVQEDKITHKKPIDN